MSGLSKGWYGTFFTRAPSLLGSLRKLHRILSDALANGESIALAQTARTAARLKPSGCAIAAVLHHTVVALGSKRDSWASTLGIGKHSLEP